MRKTMFHFVALSMLVPATGVTLAGPAGAHARDYRHYHSSGRTYYGRKYCRHSSATTGAVAGGVGGAVLGSQVLGHGLLGIGAGAVAGVVAGKAIDRTLTARRRCSYR